MFNLKMFCITSIAIASIGFSSSANALTKAEMCWNKHTACSIKCEDKHGGRGGSIEALEACWRKCDTNVVECIPGGRGEGKLEQVEPPKGPPIRPTTIPGTRPGGGILDTPSYGIPMSRPSSTGTRAPN